MNDHVVRVDSGKYTFVRSLGGIRILRHGEPWHEQTEAGNALGSIMAELDAARVVLAAVREHLQKAHEMYLHKTGGVGRSDGNPGHMWSSASAQKMASDLVNALNKHAALVDDKEQPSEWALPGGDP